MSFKFATEPSGSEYSYNLVSLECSGQPEQATEITKACTKCGEVKELSGFNKAKTGKLGRHSYCRACNAVYALSRKNNLALTVSDRAAPIEKQCSKCKVTKGVSQFTTKRTTKDTLYGNCKQCEAQATAARRQHLADTASQRATPAKKQCYICMETKSADHFHSSRRNLDTLAQGCKTCSAANDAAWARHNPDKVCARTARRRASKLQRTPSWANKATIDTIYAAAQPGALHVDHIIPLKGKKISGLHVENNLQLLTESENCSKGNRFNSESYTHTIPQATGAESLALWVCLAPHRTQTHGN